MAFGYGYIFGRAIKRELGGMALKLHGRVAVVTGSSRGIGLAIAKRLAAEGAAIVINSRDEGRAQAAAEAIEGDGRTVLAIAADVSSSVDVATLVATTVRRFGRIDVLVNNAGLPMISPSESLSEHDWRRTLDTHLTGALLCSQAVFPYMKDHGGGNIINISSILGSTAFPFRAAYVVAKHGLNGLTKVLAIEWAKYGIRVNSVCPSYIDLGREPPEGADYSNAVIERRTPLGRFGLPAEVASAVAYLASDEAAFTTGSLMTIDGGWTASSAW